MEYSNVFFQAPLDQRVFVELLQYFKGPNNILLLKQSDGLRQSPLNFYKRVRQRLESRGFHKSDHDYCPFTNGTIIVLFWVDGLIFYVEEDTSSDNLIISLEDDILLKKEEDVAGFLGISSDRLQQGSVVLRYTGLVNIILQVTSMDDSKPKYTPTDRESLCKDPEGSPCYKEWQYRLVVGTVMHLSGSSISDIIYNVHQCTRFSHNPRRSSNTPYVSRVEHACY